MSNISLGEVVTNLAAVAKRVAAGEEFVVIEDGRPVMKLAPVDTTGDMDPEALAHDLAALRKEGAAWRKAHRLTPLTIEEAVALAHEGRR